MKTKQFVTMPIPVAMLLIICGILASVAAVTKLAPKAEETIIKKQEAPRPSKVTPTPTYMMQQAASTFHGATVDLVKNRPALSVTATTSYPTSNPSRTPTPTLASFPRNLPTATPTPQSSVTVTVLSPNFGNFDTELTVYGSGFGGIQKNVWFYTPSGVNVGGGPILSWTDTQIRTKVPAVKGNTNYKIEVETNTGLRSNRVTYYVRGGQPYIASFSPNNVKPGEEVTISGDEFGNTTGSIYFYTSGSYYTPTSYTTGSYWSNTQIKATIPTSLTAGKEYGIVVETSDQRKSSMKFYQLGN